MSKMKLLLSIPLFATTTMMMVSVQAYAAKRASSSSSDYNYSSQSSSYGRAKMLADLQIQYVRDTKPTGRTDTLGKLSIGGLFSSWIGLDLFGILAAKSHDTMLGADIRLMPTDWFYMKSGVGAYSEKQTRALQITPIFGAGIIAGLGDGMYLVSEFGYFEKAESRNVSFGAGLGMYF